MSKMRSINLLVAGRCQLGPQTPSVHFWVCKLDKSLTTCPYLSTYTSSAALAWHAGLASSLSPYRSFYRARHERRLAPPSILINLLSSFARSLKSQINTSNFFFQQLRIFLLFLKSFWRYWLRKMLIRLASVSKGLPLLALMHAFCRAFLFSWNEVVFM